MNRGDIYDAELPSGRRPAVVATRDTAIPILANVTLVPITRTVRGLVTEVPVGRANGLSGEGVANCDNVATIPKAALGRRRGRLDEEQVFRLDVALRIALGLDH